MPGRFVLALLLLLGTVGVFVAVGAQVPGGRSRGTRIMAGVLPEKRTGFTFCRLIYTQTRDESGGSGWNTDYPMADQNLMHRLPEFTLTPVTRFHDGSPHHAVVRATDQALFECPFLFASDVGTVGFSHMEIERLREYLLKGGFLWVDDFWGRSAWSHWSSQIARVLPEFETVELGMDHPIFSTFYTVEKVPQIPSIQHWRRSGGGTSERGIDSAVPRIHAIFDDAGRILVLMSHNTDIADGWEREGEDWEFFHSFSPYGYAVGVNVAVWAMTH